MHRLKAYATSMPSFFLILALLSTARLPAADRDLDFVSGLRRLQLFDLAEKYCQRELASQSNTPEREAKLTIDLIRSFALEALSRPPEERASTWQQARAAAAEFQRTHAGHPQLLLIRVQDGLTLLAQGELAQQEAEAASAGPKAMAAAAEQLRTAAKALDAVNDALDKEIPLRRSKPPAASELSSDELVRLQFNVKLHLAKAQRLQALCYPADSRDRKALLLATLESLNAAVSRLDSEDELAARMRVVQMTCYRELGQLNDAHRVWKLLDREQVSSEWRRASLAEAARLFIAAKRPKEALALLDEPERADLTRVPDAELDLARLEAVLAVAGLGDEKERTQWQRAAAALAQRIDATHGRAAGRRADQLVMSLLPKDATGGNIDLLARVADNLYIKRQIDEALATYDKAAAEANAAGNSSREFELRYKAGLVEQHEKHFAAASARFERLAIDLKNHPQAAEAHLIACWNKAQQAREDEAAATTYISLLREHVSRWPQSATADQARLWLGQWHKAREEWAEAYAAYSEVSHTAKEFPAAVSAAGQCAREQLAQLVAKGEKAEEIASEHVNRFSTIAQNRDAGSKNATEQARQAALIAAELAMEYVPSGHSRAEKVLRDTLSASADADAAWKSEATSLLIAAVAGQSGRREEAEKLLQSLASDGGQLLKLLDRLAATSKRAGERTRKDLAAIELDVIDRLSSDKARFDSGQQKELERLRAESLAQLGRRDEALQVYSALAKSLPNNGAVQEAYADLLGQSTDKMSRNAALTLWRQIASKSPPRSERWCKAKYSIARLQADLGDRKSAATLCLFLLETPPGLSETGWQELFEKLQRELE
jgi:hypothetical protein